MNVIIVTLYSIVYLLIINRFKIRFCSATSEASFQYSGSSQSGTERQYDLFVLELDNKRSTNSYTYEKRSKNKDFFVTSPNHRIKAITKGGETVWTAKNKEYPNRVLYKEDDDKPLLQVIYSDAEPMSDTQARRAADIKNTTGGDAFAEFSISSGDDARRDKSYQDFDLPESGEHHRSRGVARGHRVYSSHSGTERSGREFSLPESGDDRMRGRSGRGHRDYSLPETDDERDARYRRGGRGHQDFSLPDSGDERRGGRGHQDFSIPESGEHFTVHHSNRPRARGQTYSVPETDDERHHSGRGHQDFSIPESGDDRRHDDRDYQDFSMPESGDEYTVVHSNRHPSSGRDYSLPETDDERGGRGRDHEDFSVPETDDERDARYRRGGRGHQDFSLPESGDERRGGRGHQDYSVPETDDEYDARGRGHRDYSLPETDDERDARYRRGGRSHQDFSLPDSGDERRGGRGHQDFSIPESGDDYVVSRRGAGRSYRVHTATSPRGRGRRDPRHVEVSMSSDHEVVRPRIRRDYPHDRHSVEVSLPSSDGRRPRHILDTPSHMPLHKPIPYGHVAAPQRPPLEIPSASSEAEEEEKDEEIAALERKVRELDNNLKLMRAALKLMQENEELRKQLESTSYTREPLRIKRSLHPPSTRGGPEYLRLYTENYDGTLAENDRSQFNRVQASRDLVTYTFNPDAKCVKVRYKNKEWNYNPSDPNAKYPKKVVYNGKADMIKIEKGLTEYAVMIGINS